MAIGKEDDGLSVVIVFTPSPACWRELRSADQRPVHAREGDRQIMKKKLPRLDSDEAAEKFISTADLSEYDLSGMEMVRFEFQPKTERVNMRLPRPLLDAVKASAAKAGVPYQRFIRQALETAVQRRNGI